MSHRGSVQLPFFGWRDLLIPLCPSTGPFVCLWLPATPLLFLAIALVLKVEWFPSNTTDILQIINNGTFQPSSRYF